MYQIIEKGKVIHESNNRAKAYKAERLNGSLQQVDAPKGECYSVDANGAIWEVV